MLRVKKDLPIDHSLLPWWLSYLVNCYTRKTTVRVQENCHKPIKWQVRIMDDSHQVKG